MPLPQGLRPRARPFGPRASAHLASPLTRNRFGRFQHEGLDRRLYVKIVAADVCTCAWRGRGTAWACSTTPRGRAVSVRGRAAWSRRAPTRRRRSYSASTCRVRGPTSCWCSATRTTRCRSVDWNATSTSWRGSSTSWCRRPRRDWSGRAGTPRTSARSRPRGDTDDTRRHALHSVRLCIELCDSSDACGVSSCGIWAGRRPPLGSSQAERSVIRVTVYRPPNSGDEREWKYSVIEFYANYIFSASMNVIGQRRRIFLFGGR